MRAGSGTITAAYALPVIGIKMRVHTHRTNIRASTAVNAFVIHFIAIQADRIAKAVYRA